MKRILVTGAGGYIGQQLASALSQNPDCAVYGVDIRPPAGLQTFQCTTMDIRDPALIDLVGNLNITHIVHLASIVNPGQDEALEYDIDVNGTQNVLAACRAHKVEHLTVTSSGAAYGYHADNPEWLTEQHPLRGNEAFSYSRHKRMVEDMLNHFSQQQDTTGVLIMRPCTVLGSNTQNRITALFRAKRLLAVGQSRSPFVFIWDQDVVGALKSGVLNNKTGAYNLAGDGALDVNDLARITQKPVLRVPKALLSGVLWLGKRLGLSQAGPEQIMFLQYRPVLCNHKLKTEFGYTPQKSSREAFEHFYFGAQR
ncbi:SDR family oxidoreductase [Aestuariibacter halophilus]|uniref:SDR family oxidoreductase n=1 Tax=Fluctibacter halophilus TaxID=226011 RepID=A0ABS8G6L9_9ALTE|nr:SDR family oxidoreductase [Aestuariibacter halophilus]MCC2616180.1 SDR family oxidoreductase [Aestuariibacter halophilus]